MKFYALLCAMIALAMLLTPAISLIGTNTQKETAVSEQVQTTAPAETTEAESTTENQER